jgi:hypothetical protein
MAIDSDPGFESPEVNARAILAFTFGFVAFVAVSLVLLYGYYMLSNVSAVPGPLRAFSTPQLETHNRQELNALRKQNNRSLDYAWVDRSRRLVRIPVERAMEIIATHGATAYDSPNTPPVSENHSP